MYLTKHTPDVVSTAVACEKAAGATEIIVTREMREAGASVIEELRDVVSASGLAEAVYTAMVRATIEESLDHP